MRAKSARTSIVDSYRAGLFLGEALSEIRPEIVFLFATVQYDDMGQFMDGLYDGLDDHGTRVIGATGDGIYEWQGASEVGAAALGITSDGKLEWYVESGHGVAGDPERAVHSALFKLELALDGRKPAFYYIVSDSLADGSSIESVIRDEINVPVIGGMAGHDNSNLARGYQFRDRKVMRDSVVLLAVAGEIPFEVYAFNSFVPTGENGVINEAGGKIVHRIAGVDAVSFIENAMGKPIMPADQGIALMTTGPQYPGEKRLRAFEQDYLSDGALMLRGSIAAGETVQVCVTRPDDMRLEMQSLAACLSACRFEPLAALVVSCAGRKWLAGGNIELELEELTCALKRPIPLAGFPGFGEFSPLCHHGQLTRNLFHNMTFVLLLLGK